MEIKVDGRLLVSTLCERFKEEFGGTLRVYQGQKRLTGAEKVSEIATKTGSNGTIYGSVGSIQIAEELAKLGHEVDRKIIKVANVKELGHYTATVQLHKEVAVEIPFKVISENAPKQEEAPATEEAPAVVEEAPVAEEAPAAE